MHTLEDIEHQPRWRFWHLNERQKALDSIRRSEPIRQVFVVYGQIGTSPLIQIPLAQIPVMGIERIANPVAHTNPPATLVKFIQERLDVTIRLCLRPCFAQEAFFEWRVCKHVSSEVALYEPFRAWTEKLPVNENTGSKTTTGTLKANRRHGIKVRGDFRQQNRWKMLWRMAWFSSSRSNFGSVGGRVFRPHQCPRRHVPMIVDDPRGQPPILGLLICVVHF